MKVIAQFPMARTEILDLPPELVATGCVVFHRKPHEVPLHFSLGRQGDRARVQQNKWYLKRTDELMWWNEPVLGLTVLQVWRAE